MRAEAGLSGDRAGSAANAVTQADASLERSKGGLGFQPVNREGLVELHSSELYQGDHLLLLLGRSVVDTKNATRALTLASPYWSFACVEKSYANSSVTTRAPVTSGSVSRSGRPLCVKVRRVWSMPS